jgi:hypothetical protein
MTMIMTGVPFYDTDVLILRDLSDTTVNMQTLNLVLTGIHVRLEPLEHRHLDGLVTAAAADPSLYQWSPVPQGEREAAQ